MTVGGAVQRISMRTCPSGMVTGTQVMASPVRLVVEAFRFTATPPLVWFLLRFHGNRAVDER